MKSIALLLALLLLVAHAGCATVPLPHALGLFYSYDVFCGSHPHPPAGSLHLCLNSHSGGVTRTSDRKGMAEVFTDAANAHQFVMVLFQPNATITAHTPSSSYTAYAGDQERYPGCIEFQKDGMGGWVVCPDYGTLNV